MIGIKVKTTGQLLCLDNSGTFPRNSSDTSWDFAFTPKRSGTRTFFCEPFHPFLVPAREEKVPISDWLGELQTTPRKTRKSFVKPPLYLLDEEVSAFWRFTRKASVEAAGSPSSFY